MIVPYQIVILLFNTYVSNAPIKSIIFFINSRFSSGSITNEILFVKCLIELECLSFKKTLNSRDKILAASIKSLSLFQPTMILCNHRSNLFFGSVDNSIIVRHITLIS